MPELGTRSRTTVRGMAPVAVMALALLSGCGNGGSGSVSTPPPVVNQPPAFTSAGTVTAPENIATTVYAAVASDPNGDALTYSITGGADARRFAISSSGQLSFLAPPNYDLPGDADGDNVYRLEISASDGRASTSLAVSVTVTNDKEGIAVRRIATGFTNPVAVSPVSSTAMLVAEKAGAIYLLNPQTGVKTLLVQIPNLDTVGITALAAAPTFAADGIFFAMYKSAGGSLVINRYLRNPAGPTVPDNFGPPLAVSAPLYAGGGWLGFDSAGELLAAISDAGGNGDPTKSAQDDASRLGKLLRIARNPDPYAGASPRFFIITTIAKGLHQPNGGSQFGGGILLADRGQDVAEELDLFPASSNIQNFGWPFQEGTRVVQGTAPAGLLAPVLEYFRDTGLRTGRSIVGGSIGPATIASLRNQYVFADGSGAIFAIDTSLINSGTTRASDVVERRNADFAPNVGAINTPVAVTPGPGGTLFILDGDGEIFQVEGG